MSTYFGNRLTKYEIARVIGARAEEIARGSKPLVDIHGLETNILKIAEKELREGVIPINILRPLPNGDLIRVTIKPKMKLESG